jgi:hypothetical protein
MNSGPMHRCRFSAEKGPLLGERGKTNPDAR